MKLIKEKALWSFNYYYQMNFKEEKTFIHQILSTFQFYFQKKYINTFKEQS